MKRECQKLSSDAGLEPATYRLQTMVSPGRSLLWLEVCRATFALQLGLGLDRHTAL